MAPYWRQNQEADLHGCGTRPEQLFPEVGTGTPPQIELAVQEGPITLLAETLVVYFCIRAESARSLAQRFELDINGVKGTLASAAKFGVRSPSVTSMHLVDSRRAEKVSADHTWLYRGGGISAKFDLPMTNGPLNDCDDMTGQLRRQAAWHTLYVRGEG